MFYQYPFCFRNDYYLVGGRKTVSRYLFDMIDIEIPEVTEAEAPVAARWDLPVYGGPRAAMHVRYLDGKFLIPLTRGAANAERGFMAEDLPLPGRSTPDAADHFLSTLNKHWDVGRYSAPSRAWLVAGKGHTEPKEDTIQAFLGSSHAEMKALAEKLADGLRIVEGKVYRVIDEPVFGFERDGNRVSVVIHADSTSFDRGHEMKRLAVRGPYETYFVRLDDPERAVATAREVSGQEEIINFYHDLTIELPEVFEFDEAENSVARSVGKIIHEYAKIPSTEWDRQALLAFLDANHDYMAYLDDPESHDILEIMDRVHAVVTNHPGFRGDKAIEFLKMVEFAETAPLKIKGGAIGIAHAPMGNLPS